MYLNPETVCTLDIEYPNLSETFCNCLPFDGRVLCATSEDCPEGEVCAVQHEQESAATCVSCFALGDATWFGFDVKDEDDTTCNSLPTPAPSPTATPSARPSPSTYAYDLCFGGIECDDGSFCGHAIHADTVCESKDTKCICTPYPHTPCSDSSPCPQGTACIDDARNATRYCAGCVAIAQRAEYLPVDERGVRCKERMNSVKPLTSVYPIAPNGFTLDVCYTDAMCAGDRICVEGRKLETLMRCPLNATTNYCMCYPPGKSVPCSSSEECEPGELCATTPGLSFTLCYSSNLLLYGTGPAGAKIRGSTIPATSPGDIEEHGSDGGVKGLTGAWCKYDWHCAEPRRCRHVTENTFGACAGRRTCICEPLVPTRCTQSEDCDAGEACAKIVDTRIEPTCRNVTAVISDPLYEFVESGTATAPSEPAETADEVTEDAEAEAEASPLPTSGSRLSGEPCGQGADCDSGICRHAAERAGECAGRKGCRCVAALDPAAGCVENSECEPGELCAVVIDQVIALVPAFCLSARVLAARRDLYVEYATTLISPSPSPSESNPPPLPNTPSPSSPNDDGDNDEGACVDARALAHLPRSRLVFPAHRRATVLCDATGSCATPSHFVIWNRRPMSMAAYCAGAGCVRCVMRVNSPRMRVALRMPSNTPGLQFTALAARFRSALEERLLRLFLHLGV